MTSFSPAASSPAPTNQVPPSDTNEVNERCEASWREMPSSATAAARELASGVAKEFGVTVSFHTHAGKAPEDDVLFGARFCGVAADTYFAGRAWQKALDATPPKS